jgi:hypothetical protein
MCAVLCTDSEDENSTTGTLRYRDEGTRNSSGLEVAEEYYYGKDEVRLNYFYCMIYETE